MKKNKGKGLKKRKSSKEAKFFCESCGSEVPRNAKVCPTCGKFFASVRCPKCGTIGSNDDFKNGCPECGYAVNPDSVGLGGSAGGFSGSGSGGRRNDRKNRLDSSIFRGRGANSSKKGEDSSLPLWIYIVSILVLAVLVVYLYSCL